MKQSKFETWIQDYLASMVEADRAKRTIDSHSSVLKRFRMFSEKMQLTAEKAVLPQNRAIFLAEWPVPHASAAMTRFAGYLGKKGILEKGQFPESLPAIYEQYITRYQKIRRITKSRLHKIRKILLQFHAWMTDREIKLDALKINQVDEFLKHCNQGLAPRTSSDNRGIVKGFLRYLYIEKKLFERDLGSMIVSAPIFAYENPPRYLEKDEVRKLFEGLDYTTVEGLRASAMTWIAYTTGLRPGEIANMKFEDISFGRGELTVPKRKGFNPMLFTLPEDTVKAIAAYVIGARPKNSERNLFLTISPPLSPVTGGLVADVITKTMKQCGVPGTAYWLRHTYAQNLLESGASIFEIKEMLGHDCLKATKRYLHIHIKLMREVLFDD